MARIIGVLTGAGLLVVFALFAVLMCFVSVFSGKGAISFLWFGVAVVAVISAVFIVVASGPRDEADKK